MIKAFLLVYLAGTATTANFGTVAMEVIEVSPTATAEPPSFERG